MIALALYGFLLFWINKIWLSNKHILYLLCAINESFVFSAFYMLYLETALFCTKPSAQIFLCHVTYVRYCNCFRWFALQHYWSLITQSARNFSLILFKVETLAWSQFAQKQTFEKDALKVSYPMDLYHCVLSLNYTLI